MELANIRSLTFSGKSGKYNQAGWRGKVPTYLQARKLSSVIVDDFLCVDLEENNKELLDWYLQNDFELIPICRRAHPSDSSKPVVDDFPKRVLLELTSWCNLNCVMCPRTVLERKIMHMPKELALKCINELSEYGIQGLWLYNIGESMLHPDFTEILDYCETKETLGSTWLSTNGQRLLDHHAKKIIGSKLTFLNFSLNALNAESYAKISPAGKYEFLRANLEKLFSEKQRQNRMGKTPWLRVQMIDQPQIANSDIDTFFDTFGRRTEIVGINRLEAFSKDVEQNISHATLRARSNFKQCNRVSRGDCFIFADGEVSFCDTDFNHKMSLGNIIRKSIKEVWNSGFRQEVISLNKSGKLKDLELCKDCLDYDL